VDSVVKRAIFQRTSRCWQLSDGSGRSLVIRRSIFPRFPAPGSRVLIIWLRGAIPPGGPLCYILAAFQFPLLFKGHHVNGPNVGQRTIRTTSRHASNSMAMLRFRFFQHLLRACALAALVALAGCQSIIGYRGWPLPEHDHTSFHTPAMRIDTVKQFASRADGTNSEDQREYTDQLARQIQIEPDPIVRKEIIRATSQFGTPLAHQILEAGLRDESPMVRIACCEALGRRANVLSVSSLAAVLRDDEETDVRLAATEALGKIKDPTAIAAVAIALDDHDPALQFVGVQSMQSLTGKHYGGDVAAWRQMAAGENPPEPKPVSIAERIRNAARF